MAVTAAPAFVPRRIPLPGHRTMVVRAVATADVDALVALYAGLGSEDRYRRFFTAYRPTREFFEQLAAPDERNGFGLVAEVEGPGPNERRIVAEAGYTGLPDGDGELAITVDREWRGWLGPYLLDALLEAAATRGVPNLEAEILTTNQPMLALVRSRGYATLEHPDWTVVRVVIGAASRRPQWPGEHDRGRVLVEVPGGRWHAADEARAAGLQVLACPGPGSRGAPCPVLAGEPCPLVSGADVVVVARPPDDDPWRSLLDAHAQLQPGIPVCVEPRPRAGQPSGERSVVALVERLARARRDVTEGDPAS